MVLSSSATNGPLGPLAFVSPLPILTLGNVLPWFSTRPRCLPKSVCPQIKLCLSLPFLCSVAQNMTAFSCVSWAQLAQKLWLLTGVQEMDSPGRRPNCRRKGAKRYSSLLSSPQAALPTATMHLQQLTEQEKKIKLQISFSVAKKFSHLTCECSIYLHFFQSDFKDSTTRI